MTTVADVLGALERIAPSRFALGFDRIGLQVGDLSAIVSRGVVSLDRSLDAIDFAVSQGAHLLLSHHPLIFEPLVSVTSETYEGRAVMRLVQNGIAHIAAHTNWDAAQGGVSDALAAVFELAEVTSFGMVADPPEQPIGRVGVLPSAMRLGDFLVLADERLDTRSWAWGDPERVVQRLAVAGGAADGDWRAALSAGADVYLTGEVKQHHALEASESGLAMVASGHYATEQPGVVALRNRLATELPGIEFTLFIPVEGRHGRPFTKLSEEERLRPQPLTEQKHLTRG